MVSPEPSASTQCPCPSPASLDPEAEPGKKPKKRSRHHQRVLAQRSALSVGAPGTPRPCAPVPWPVPLAPCPRAAFLGRPRPGAAGDPWVAGDRVASPSKCVAIDCEMVGTGPGGRVSELARCSVVSYHGDVLYDKYVLPERPVTDFRSRWSGVTQRHLSKAVPFQEARKEILKLLKGKVVVGHALHNDFQALKYAHPRSHTRDTTCVPSLLSAHGAPARARVSLKDLALQLLRKRIQVGQHGHSSVEDAATAMELYRLVEARWEAHMGGLCAQAQEDREAETGSDMQQFMDDRYWPEDLGPGPGGTRGPCGE